MRFGLIGAILFAVMGLAQPSQAADSVTLTIQTVGATTANELTLADLKAIGRTEITTTTPWTEGQQSFVGVTGAQLVAALKATGQSVTAVANNDYSIDIPMEVFSDPDTLIAYERNGQPMPVSDKGPLWIVFPFDRDARFVSESFKSYAIWGLLRIEFY